MASERGMRHIFCIMSVIQKYLSKKKRRFYGLFVDFAKAFDCIKHTHLFYRLIKVGIHGKIYYLMKDMYSKLQACVKIPGVFQILSWYKAGLYD